MDRQALELQEDLDLVLGDLDAQLLVPMDVRCAVVVAIDVDVAVGVQLRRLPLPAVVLHAGQRLECGFLDRLEALAARDAKAAVALIVDALDADHERAIDLLDGGESGAPIAEAHVAHQDFDQPFDDRLILRFSETRRNDCGGEVRGQMRVVLVQIRIVQMALDDTLLQAIRHRHVRHATVVGKHAPMSSRASCGSSCPRPPRQTAAG